MNFNQAVEELILGKSIRRFGWDKFSYLKLNEINDVGYYFMDLSQYLYDQSIILSEGWLIKDSDQKPMSWLSALESLKMGAELYLPLPSWEGKTIVLEKNDNEIVLKQFLQQPFTPTFVDFTATDWESF